MSSLKDTLRSWVVGVAGVAVVDGVEGVVVAAVGADEPSCVGL